MPTAEFAGQTADAATPPAAAASRQIGLTLDLFRPRRRSGLYSDPRGGDNSPDRFVPARRFNVVLPRFSRALATGIAVAALAFGTLTTSSAVAAPADDRDFPDPDVSKFGNTYYAYATNQGKNLPWASAPDPDGPWTFQSTDALPTLGAWAKTGRTWAPDVSRRADGKYLLYYTAWHN